MALELNLDKNLSDPLSEAALQNGDSATTAREMGGALQRWLATSIYPILIGAVVVCTMLAVFYGAFLYFTAYGDEARAQTAKKTITAGFIGLFIALAAFGIMFYVRQNLVDKQTEQNLQILNAPVKQ